MVLVEVLYEGGFSTRCVHSENQAVINTDAPKDNHGKGQKFSPTDLIAAALGSCILTVMGIAADKLKVDLSGAKLSIHKEMENTSLRRIGSLKIDFYCPRDFPDAVKRKLENAALHCPVHQSLHPDIKQEMVFSWGS